MARCAAEHCGDLLFDGTQLSSMKKIHANRHRFTMGHRPSGVDIATFITSLLAVG
jgi:hypothetical protein